MAMPLGVVDPIPGDPPVPGDKDGDRDGCWPFGVLKEEESTKLWEGGAGVW